jgi:hypothetical protein
LLLSSIVFDGFLGSTGTRTGTSSRHPEQTVNGRVPPPHGCPAAACGGVSRLPPVATIEDPAVIRKIVTHLGLPTEVPAPQPPPRDLFRLELSPSAR